MGSGSLAGLPVNTPTELRPLIEWSRHWSLDPRPHTAKLLPWSAEVEGQITSAISLQAPTQSLFIRCSFRSAKPPYITSPSCRAALGCACVTHHCVVWSHAIHMNSQSPIPRHCGWLIGVTPCPTHGAHDTGNAPPGDGQATARGHDLPYQTVSDRPGAPPQRPVVSSAGHNPDHRGHRVYSGGSPIVRRGTKQRIVPRGSRPISPCSSFRIGDCDAPLLSGAAEGG